MPVSSLARVLVVDGYLGPARADGRTASRASVGRWQIERWTLTRGWRLAAIVEEAGTRSEAGARTSLELAVVRIEARERDGLVTPSLDQLGDSLGEVLLALERIEAAGGTFASVREGIDLSTPAGRAMLRLLFSVLDW